MLENYNLMHLPNGFTHQLTTDHLITSPVSLFTNTLKVNSSINPFYRLSSSLDTDVANVITDSITPNHDIQIDSCDETIINQLSSHYQLTFTGENQTDFDYWFPNLQIDFPSPEVTIDMEIPNPNLHFTSSPLSSTSNPQPTYTTQSYNFSPVYGDGLIDAANAVATAIGLPRFSDIPNHSNIYTWGLDAISVPEVWTQGYTGEGVVVAVIDSGVDFTHPDLDDNIWINTGEIFGDGIDNDGNGYIDDLIGWDFVGNDYNPMDEETHGTHVAGIIAAEANGYGMVGVAYNAKIMPIRVFDANGRGTQKDFIKGIIYAADNGADVINLSLTTGGYSPEVEAAVKYATERGAIVVMAAGNNGGEEPVYPAALAKYWGIAVGAIDINYNMADFSNRAGSDSSLYYVVAPGKDIYSTTPNDTYGFLSGTSMATPYVSGVAALMLSANPDLTPADIRQIIAATAIG
ncbi:S8 family peptidase [Calothrix sp. NIES-3974]|uniref:S8 family peptidase n=1 Tax=Calothrix sp. NIES-3974 TaxID=2005462 RepID=UPI000B6106E5|nr:S8 family peptidase [Calothrix sp. NIES-3974]BAZ05956.1 peptidase S8/S53 [Calothrix sp. NIES-3974]